ncbi:DNA polymerase [Campylobacter sp. RM12651]|uniref:DNA polymerase n=1 Tax=Campylobacter sp. RM12651 TaxID=1660079 RepID=UPI001EFB15F4|nr:DNA polymerase [Campylobacter sp. RM12651]ULO04516.1 hypothetical protein AVBRAN_a0034 [Campylobacter sp. RM12651]
MKVYTPTNKQELQEILKEVIADFNNNGMIEVEINTSEITDFSNLFDFAKDENGNVNLPKSFYEDIGLTKWDFSKANNLENMLNGCKNCNVEIIINSKNTNINISNAFANTNIEPNKINIPAHENIKGLEDIFGADKDKYNAFMENELLYNKNTSFAFKELSIYDFARYEIINDIDSTLSVVNSEDILNLEYPLRIGKNDERFSENQNEEIKNLLDESKALSFKITGKLLDNEITQALKNNPDADIQAYVYNAINKKIEVLFGQDNNLKDNWATYLKDINWGVKTNEDGSYEATIVLSTHNQLNQKLREKIIADIAQKEKALNDFIQTQTRTTQTQIIPITAMIELPTQQEEEKAHEFIANISNSSPIAKYDLIQHGLEEIKNTIATLEEAKEKPQEEIKHNYTYNRKRFFDYDSSLAQNIANYCKASADKSGKAAWLGLKCGIKMLALSSLEATKKIGQSLVGSYIGFFGVGSYEQYKDIVMNETIKRDEARALAAKLSMGAIINPEELAKYEHILPREFLPSTGPNGEIIPPQRDINECREEVAKLLEHTLQKSEFDVWMNHALLNICAGLAESQQVDIARRARGEDVGFDKLIRELDNSIRKDLEKLNKLQNEFSNDTKDFWSRTQEMLNDEYPKYQSSKAEIKLDGAIPKVDLSNVKFAYKTRIFSWNGEASKYDKDNNLKSEEQYIKENIFFRTTSDLKDGEERFTRYEKPLADMEVKAFIDKDEILLKKLKDNSLHAVHLNVGELNNQILDKILPPNHPMLKELKNDPEAFRRYYKGFLKEYLLNQNSILYEESYAKAPYKIMDDTFTGKDGLILFFDKDEVKNLNETLRDLELALSAITQNARINPKTGESNFSVLIKDYEEKVKYARQTQANRQKQTGENNQTNNTETNQDDIFNTNKEAEVKETETTIQARKEAVKNWKQFYETTHPETKEKKYPFNWANELSEFNNDGSPKSYIQERYEKLYAKTVIEGDLVSLIKDAGTTAPQGFYGSDLSLQGTSDILKRKNVYFEITIPDNLTNSFYGRVRPDAYAQALARAFNDPTSFIKQDVNFPSSLKAFYKDNKIFIAVEDTESEKAHRKILVAMNNLRRFALDESIESRVKATNEYFAKSNETATYKERDKSDALRQKELDELFCCENEKTIKYNGEGSQYLSNGDKKSDTQLRDELILMNTFKAKPYGIKASNPKIWDGLGLSKAMQEKAKDNHVVMVSMTLKLDENLINNKIKNISQDEYLKVLTKALIDNNSIINSQSGLKGAKEVVYQKNIDGTYTINLFQEVFNNAEDVLVRSAVADKIRNSISSFADYTYSTKTSHSKYQDDMLNYELEISSKQQNTKQTTTQEDIKQDNQKEQEEPTAKTKQDNPQEEPKKEEVKQPNQQEDKKQEENTTEIKEEINTEPIEKEIDTRNQFLYKIKDFKGNEHTVILQDETTYFDASNMDNLKRKDNNILNDEVNVLLSSVKNITATPTQQQIEKLMALTDYYPEDLKQKGLNGEIASVVINLDTFVSKTTQEPQIYNSQKGIIDTHNYLNSLTNMLNNQNSIFYRNTNLEPLKAVLLESGKIALFYDAINPNNKDFTNTLNKQFSGILALTQDKISDTQKTIVAFRETAESVFTSLLNQQEAEALKQEQEKRKQEEERAKEELEKLQAEKEQEILKEQQAKKEQEDTKILQEDIDFIEDYSDDILDDDILAENESIEKKLAENENNEDNQAQPLQTEDTKQEENYQSIKQEPADISQEPKSQNENNLAIEVINAIREFKNFKGKNALTSENIQDRFDSWYEVIQRYKEANTESKIIDKASLQEISEWLENNKSIKEIMQQPIQPIKEVNPNEELLSELKNVEHYSTILQEKNKNSNIQEDENILESLQKTYALLEKIKKLAENDNIDINKTSSLNQLEQTMINSIRNLKSEMVNLSSKELEKIYKDISTSVKNKELTTQLLESFDKQISEIVKYVPQQESNIFVKWFNNDFKNDKAMLDKLLAQSNNISTISENIPTQSDVSQEKKVSQEDETIKNEILNNIDEVAIKEASLPQSENKQIIEEEQKEIQQLPQEEPVNKEEPLQIEPKQEETILQDNDFSEYDYSMSSSYNDDYPLDAYLGDYSDNYLEYTQDTDILAENELIQKNIAEFERTQQLPQEEPVNKEEPLQIEPKQEYKQETENTKYPIDFKEAINLQNINFASISEIDNKVINLSLLMYKNSTLNNQFYTEKPIILGQANNEERQILSDAMEKILTSNVKYCFYNADTQDIEFPIEGNFNEKNIPTSLSRIRLHITSFLTHNEAVNFANMILANRVVVYSDGKSEHNIFKDNADPSLFKARSINIDRILDKINNDYYANDVQKRKEFNNYLEDISKYKDRSTNRIIRHPGSTQVFKKFYVVYCRSFSKEKNELEESKLLAYNKANPNTQRQLAFQGNAFETIYKEFVKQNDMALNELINSHQNQRQVVNNIEPVNKNLQQASNINIETIDLSNIPAPRTQQEIREQRQRLLDNIGDKSLVADFTGLSNIATVVNTEYFGEILNTLRKALSDNTHPLHELPINIIKSFYGERGLASDQNPYLYLKKSLQQIATELQRDDTKNKLTKLFNIYDFNLNKLNTVTRESDLKKLTLIDPNGDFTFDNLNIDAKSLGINTDWPFKYTLLNGANMSPAIPRKFGEDIKAYKARVDEKFPNIYEIRNPVIEEINNTIKELQIDYKNRNVGDVKNTELLNGFISYLGNPKDVNKMNYFVDAFASKVYDSLFNDKNSTRAVEIAYSSLVKNESVRDYIKNNLNSTTGGKKSLIKTLAERLEKVSSIEKAIIDLKAPERIAINSSFHSLYNTDEELNYAMITNTVQNNKDLMQRTVLVNLIADIQTLINGLNVQVSAQKDLYKNKILNNLGEGVVLPSENKNVKIGSRYELLKTGRSSSRGENVKGDRIGVSIQSFSGKTEKFLTLDSLNNFGFVDYKKTEVIKDKIKDFSSNMILKGDKADDFVSIDLAQAEIRAVAVLSQDKRLIGDLSGGKDLHAETADNMNSVLTEKDKKVSRSEAKQINFQMLYGAGVERITEAVGLIDENFRQKLDDLFKLTKMTKGVNEALENIQEKINLHKKTYPNLHLLKDAITVCSRGIDEVNKNTGNEYQREIKIFVNSDKKQISKEFFDCLIGIKPEDSIVDKTRAYNRKNIAGELDYLKNFSGFVRSYDEFYYNISKNKDVLYIADLISNLVKIETINDVSKTSVKTLFGFETEAFNPKMASTKALNSLLQGSVADIIEIGLANLEKNNISTLAQVHDEIILSLDSLVKDKQLDLSNVEKIQEALENPLSKKSLIENPNIASGLATPVKERLLANDLDGCWFKSDFEIQKGKKLVNEEATSLIKDAFKSYKGIEAQKLVNLNGLINDGKELNYSNIQTLLKIQKYEVEQEAKTNTPQKELETNNFLGIKMFDILKGSNIQEEKNNYKNILDFIKIDDIQALPKLETNNIKTMLFERGLAGKDNFSILQDKELLLSFAEKVLNIDFKTDSILKIMNSNLKNGSFNQVLSINFERLGENIEQIFGKEIMPTLFSNNGKNITNFLKANNDIAVAFDPTTKIAKSYLEVGFRSDIPFDLDKKEAEKVKIDLALTVLLPVLKDELLHLKNQKLEKTEYLESNNIKKDEKILFYENLRDSLNNRLSKEKLQDNDEIIKDINFLLSLKLTELNPNGKNTFNNMLDNRNLTKEAFEDIIKELEALDETQLDSISFTNKIKSVSSDLKSHYRVRDSIKHITTQNQEPLKNDDTSIYQQRL